ncbi:MAG: hypothetical protein ACI9A7_001485 [Cyclobacteriaceae bacterium]|jgi:hypothetical protein
MAVVDDYEVTKQLRLKGTKLPIMDSALLDECLRMEDAGMNNLLPSFSPRPLISNAGGLF